MPALTTCGLFRRIAAVVLSVTALAVCNGCSDPSHAGEQGGESPLSDVLPPTAAALAEQAPQSRDGRVLGTVRTAQAGAPIAVNGAVVSLEDGINSIVAPTAVSDASGHFEIGSHPPGRYRLCAVSQGFTRTCMPDPVVIEAETQYLAYDLTLRATSGALSGRLLLADGSPCFQYTGAFDTLVFADVTLRGPQGSMHASGNDRGEFVLAGIPGPGDYSITAKCGGGEVTQALTVTRAQLGGGKSLDFTIPNSRPVIRVLVPQDDHGQALRAFLPGQTIRVVAETVDRDTSDVLTYKWTDGTRGFKSVNARIIQWTLPTVEARSFLNVEVSDGKGGYAVQQLTVGTSNTGARFIGTLADPNGKPLADAKVTLDGTPASVDEEGNFRAAVPSGERHVLTIQHAGYAPVSKVFYGPAPGLKVILKPASHKEIDPTQPIRVIADGVSFSLEANQLVDQDGRRPTGMLSLYLYRYDASQGELPGDPTATSAGRDVGAFASLGAVYVGILDQQGRRYDIVPGATAALRFPIRSMPSAVAGAAPLLVNYDEAKGSWSAHGAPAIAAQGARDSANSISRLGVWSAAIPSGDTACLQVSVDLFTLERPFNLRLHVPGAGPTLRDFTITEPVTLIPFLPASVDVQLDVTPLDAPSRPIFSTKAKTGGNLSSLPPFPYTACGDGINNGFVKLTAKLPSDRWLDRFGGSDDAGLAYYASIRAVPFKMTFDQWLSANGFTSADKKNEVDFYNPNELGLGRKVNCKRTQFHQACYVTKFGHVGGSPSEAFDDTFRNTNPGDTVAMESDRVDTSKPPQVKFYIYRPNGMLVTNTQFDTGGPKFVPTSCQHCHGGRHPENGNFVVLDPHAYQYPGVSKSSPHGLDAQQEKFRLINETVAFSHVHTGPYYDFLSSLYPDGAPVGVHKAGAKAIAAPVPPAWKDDAFIYNNVVKPSCRTCHMWQSPGFSFATPADVHVLSAPYVCFGEMPKAMSPMLRLWKTTNPNLVHAFSDSRFGKANGGCGGKGTTPKLTVMAPSGSVTAGSAVAHHALTSDPEDGPNCCTVRWSSDVDGQIGVGRDFAFTYPSKGPRTLTAVATDKDGRMDIKSFALNVGSAVPKLTILSPTGPVGYGGLNVVVHKASVSDVEDGSACCTVTWHSDKDGQLGVGKEVEFVYTSPGTRTITATATDSDGVSTAKSFALEVRGSPPFVSIDVPAPKAAVFQNTVVVAHAVSSDVNEPFGLPCTSLTWSSSKTGDAAFPFTGCGKAISFPTVGKRTITLKGVDKDGLTATATRQVDVKAVPAQSPPIVTIVDPHDHVLLDPGTAQALNGSVSPGAGTVTFRWTINQGTGEVDIGTTQTLSWIPGNNLPFHCGGNSAVLKFYATNAKGTGSTSINVTAFYPVC